MYEYLEGRLAERGPTRLVLDVGGVGYDLAVPLGASFAETEPLRVWTHLVVREDAHLLFGFPDAPTRDLFRLLLRVRGVGPGTALGVMSGLPPDALLEAIRDGDAARFTAVKGIGRKTAEQIVLDLKDRTDALVARLRAGDPGVLVPAAPPRVGTAVEDAVQALVSLGYGEKEARRSVERASVKVGAADVEQLVRAAIGVA